MQVVKASGRNDHIIAGSRQFVKTVSIAATGLTPIRSMKSTTAATAIAFHPTADSIIASAGSNGEVSIWYYGAQNVAPLNDKWVAHTRAIHAMEFLPQRAGGTGDSDSAVLLTASADGDINCWDVCGYSGKKETWRKPTLLANLRAEGLRCGLRDLDVRLATSGGHHELVIACDDGSVELYALRSPTSARLIAKVNVSTQTINSCKWNGARPMFATGGKDSYIRVFSLSGKNDVTQMCSIRCQSSVWAIRWRPTGRHIAACQSVMDSCIYVWDLESRLMPAYIFNSHRDNVTDFFWADSSHILSCSRDNTVQLHAIKNAVIPIEKMRTVNIAFNVASEFNSYCQTVTSVCDVVNRDRFEKEHDDLDLESIRQSGFQSSTNGDSVAKVACEDSVPASRTIVIKPVDFKPGFSFSHAQIGASSKALTRFILDVSTLTDAESVSRQCAS